MLHWRADDNTLDRFVFIFGYTIVTACLYGVPSTKYRIEYEYSTDLRDENGRKI